MATTTSPDRSLAEVLAIVSHDIRAPLGVILGAVTELLDPQVGPLTDEQRTLVQLVRRSSEKLARLAANVLFLNRVATGKVELALQRTDARVLARRAVESFERSGESARLKVTLDVGAEATDIDADAERAVHAIVNMLANAVRFARAEVRVAVVADVANVRVVVEDDGPGLSAEVMPLLFDVDARMKAAAGRPMRGLGLLIVKGIIAAHGGEVSAATRTDDAGRPLGARVVLAFPRAQTR